MDTALIQSQSTLERGLPSISCLSGYRVGSELDCDCHCKLDSHAKAHRFLNRKMWEKGAGWVANLLMMTPRFMMLCM